MKCTNDLRELGDPPCASMDEINMWLDKKAAHIRVLNKKVDFSLYDDSQVRQNEIWLPTVQFRAGIYTDQGYRFRQNYFDKEDHWFPGMG